MLLGIRTVKRILFMVFLYFIRPLKIHFEKIFILYACNDYILILTIILKFRNQNLITLLHTNMQYDYFIIRYFIKLKID